MEENTQHTPEPWERSGRTVFALTPKGVNRFAASVQDAFTDTGELEETARRIVACVNACAGIPTDALELLSKFVNPMNRLDRLSDLAIAAANQALRDQCAKARAAK